MYKIFQKKSMQSKKYRYGFNIIGFQSHVDINITTNTVKFIVRRGMVSSPY